MGMYRPPLLVLLIPGTEALSLWLLSLALTKRHSPTL